MLQSSYVYRTNPDAATPFLTALLDTLDDAIATISSEGLITSWNGAGESLYGFGPAASKIYAVESGLSAVYAISDRAAQAVLYSAGEEVSRIGFRAVPGEIARLRF